MGVPAEHPHDDGLRAVLAAFGVPPGALLGHGGEAWVHALDGERVLRVLHAGTVDDLRSRMDLVDELRRRNPELGHQLPEVLEIGTVGDRTYAIERRLPGRSVKDLLATVTGDARRQLVVAHLDAAARLGDLVLEARPWFGDLLAPDPIRAPSWRAWLEAKLAWSLARSPGFGRVDVERLCRDLPDCDQRAFVHLDAYAGNMLAVGSTISAVIDIGATAAVGDRRLDAVTAAVYLCADAITPEVGDTDRAVVRAWLSEAELLDWFDPVRRWIAGYWAHAVDDHQLHEWCRDVLL